jgi:hypothetical protein
MRDLLFVVAGLSTPVKVAWAVWMLWGVGQLLWYRRSRTQDSAYVPPYVPPRTHSSAARRAVALPPRAGNPEFLAALEREQEALREGGLQPAPTPYS